MSEIVPTSTDLSLRLEAEIAAARETLAAAHAGATLRAYASDWIRFCEFCDARHVEALPAHPDIVALFLEMEGRAGKSPVTVSRRVAAINHHHKDAGLATPVARDAAGTIAAMLRGVKKVYARPASKKAPAEADVLAAMLATIGGASLRATRDRALLAIGMASALRRSELVAIRMEHLRWQKAGLRILIPRSKGDQTAQGAEIAVPEGRSIRPVSLLREWLGSAGHDSGPLFRRLTRADGMTDFPMTDKSVARLIKAAAAAAGLDPANYSGHSLRSGFLTEAANKRANIFKMKDHARHKSLDTVAGYVRSADIFDDHAGDDFL